MAESLENVKLRIDRAQKAATALQPLPIDVEFLIYEEVPNLVDNLETSLDHSQQWALLYTQAYSFALSKGLEKELIAYLKANGSKPFENKWKDNEQK